VVDPSSSFVPTDPADPIDDCDNELNGNIDACSILSADPDNVIGTLDCDGDGINNADECLQGTDPTDPCSNSYATGSDLCAYILANPTSTLATEDCDGGGIDNITECNNGGNPLVPGDDCMSADSAGVDICVLLASDPTNPIGAADCDEDGNTNLEECNASNDPSDPCSNN